MHLRLLTAAALIASAQPALAHESTNPLEALTRFLHPSAATASERPARHARSHYRHIRTAAHTMRARAQAEFEAAAEADVNVVAVPGPEAVRGPDVEPAHMPMVASAAVGAVAEPDPPVVNPVLSTGRGSLDAMIERHAALNNIPVALVHRVVRRESGYNARVVSRGNYGLMQIKLGTARSLGYNGNAAGLLDPETNLIYAVRYLAGAYQAAHGNAERAVHYYASGYYVSARRYRHELADSAHAR